VNKEKYIEILRLLRDADRRKRHDKWRTNSWFLLYDNAPVGFDQEFLRKEWSDYTGASPILSRFGFS
jgi:hypothetical protein